MVVVNAVIALGIKQDFFIMLVVVGISLMLGLGSWYFNKMIVKRNLSEAINEK